jgi:hypothetical protein
MAREDGFTHIQIGQGRLPLKTLHRHFSGGGEYLYRFAPEAEFALLTPFGIQVYPLLSEPQGPKDRKHRSSVVENQTFLSEKYPTLTSETKMSHFATPIDAKVDSAEEKPKTLTYIGRKGRERGMLKQTPWMFD